jgi:MFS transporter, DHA1 family, tetracycline resistance protein
MNSPEITAPSRSGQHNALVRHGTAPRLPREVRVLALCAFMIAMGYGVVAPALPAFARSFDVGVLGASAIVSAFAVARVVFAPISGRIVGPLGELRVFCSGLLIVAASSAACGFATDYGQLLVFRAAGGLGSTMFTVSEASLLVRVSPPALRGRASGAWAAAFLVGNVAGPLFGGGLIAGNLRAPFLAYAGVLVLTVLVAGSLLRGRVGPRPEQQTTTTVTFAAAFCAPAFRAALTSNFVNGWSVYGVWIALVPLFVVDVVKRPGSWAGIVLAAFAAGTGATLLIGGRWADRRGRKLPVLVGSATVAFASLWLGVSGTTAELIAAALLAGVGTGLLNPAVTAAVTDVIAADGPDARGSTALAGFQMVGDVGAIIGPILAGLIVEWAGYPVAFATTAAIAVISFVYWLSVPRTVPLT